MSSPHPEDRSRESVPSDRPEASGNPGASDPSPPPGPARPGTAEPRKATFLQTASAVFWSFFGVRKRRQFESDTRLNPVHVIVMGLIGAAVFVGTLLTIVSLIIGSR